MASADDDQFIKRFNTLGLVDNAAELVPSTPLFDWHVVMIVATNKQTIRRPLPPCSIFPYLLSKLRWL